MSVAKITRKGQITIPKDVRDRLGITEADHVVVVLDGDKAILRPAHHGSLSGLKGWLPATKPYPGSSKIRHQTGLDLGKRQKRLAK